MIEKMCKSGESLRCCIGCGREFIADKFHPYQKYCGIVCGARGSVVKVCSWCGERYKVPERFSAESKACSRSCLAKWRKSRLTPEEKEAWARATSNVRWSKYDAQERHEMFLGSKNPRFGTICTDITRGKIAEKAFGRVSWCRNLTKDTDIRLRRAGEKIKGRKNPMFGKIPSIKCNKNFHVGTRRDIGHFVRSSWEANVCRIFNLLGIEYEYEVENFDLGKVSYTPDFKLGTHYFCEVKGYLREGSRIKMELFRKLNPEKVLYVIDKRVYKILRREFRYKIANWEN